uniref:Uncharacterized protein n=1 Tax=Romanomermis culicivorax TaxID=13658 RepID=A0A915II80_ROMCU
MGLGTSRKYRHFALSPGKGSKCCQIIDCFGMKRQAEKALTKIEKAICQWRRMNYSYLLFNFRFKITGGSVLHLVLALRGGNLI